jgi:3-oxoacyl-[acyl-carrier-protein] synthase II|tara:strand:+ start:7507 stop:8769 length:1263 start_codon:yes stop_codon:yes gene_type:complete
MELKRVVVTGLGALTPIGNNLKDYWEGLKNGVSGAARITYFDPELHKTQFACELKNFNIGDFLDRKEIKRMDRFSQYAMVASDEAIIDAGLTEGKFDPDRVGVIWGSGIGGLETFQNESQGLMKSRESKTTPRFNPFFIPKMIVDIAAGNISIKHGFRGPNYATVSACASSSHAMIDAFTYIRMGKADAIITGGSEAAVNETGIGGFNACMALSTNNENAAEASRPFDATRDGFVLGEGAGALILEEYEHAVARGAKIYAEIVGGGMSADAHHMTAPHPEGLGAINVMKAALEDAELSIDDIDYVNVHGTSTPLGDVAELTAIQKVFGEKAYDLNISSTKSMTGHLLGAAGAIESIATIMAVKENFIPPTINHTTPDENIDQKLNLTLNKGQEREVNFALTNTFGFGGHNASIVIKKYKR